MERTERFYKMKNLLDTRRFVTKEVFLDALEVSLSTFKRDLEYLRDRFYAPIIWDRELGGYRYDNKEVKFELPGIWFSDSEIKMLMELIHKRDKKLIENISERKLSLIENSIYSI